jgi:hypothetical protein
MATILDIITKALPPSLRPFAKAVLPALATLIALGVQAATSGTLDTAEISTAITGLSAALIAYLATNHSDLTVETDDVPAVNDIEAFAANLAGLSGVESQLGLDGDEDLLVDASAANSGNGEALLTNGPRG